MITKSKGHLFFIAVDNYKKEYFERNNQIYSAPTSNVIMPDGYRTGRWEVRKEQLDTLKSFIEKYIILD